jgi:hypothetical protein
VELSLVLDAERTSGSGLLSTSRLSVADFQRASDRAGVALLLLGRDL